MPAHRWLPAEVARFLEAVDQRLEQPFRLVVIGGSAVALGYDVDIATEDIDSFETKLKEIETAIAGARAATGLAIPVRPAPVGELPWNYDGRLIRVLPELSRLVVLVPERHDLSLSKLVRGQENDMLHVVELHRRYPLDLDTLIERHNAETDHMSDGTRRELYLNLLDGIERLWGELPLERAKVALKAPP